MEDEVALSRYIFFVVSSTAQKCSTSLLSSSSWISRKPFIALAGVIKILHILRSFGIPKKIVSAIGLLYNKTKSPVLVDDTVSKSFDVNIDVLQGDTL